jgi:uncharacterized membrane protein
MAAGQDDNPGAPESPIADRPEAGSDPSPAGPDPVPEEASASTQSPAEVSSIESPEAAPAPAAPADPAPAAPPDRVLPSVARSLALAGLLGAALALFVMTSLSSGWLPAFLRDNELPMPHRTRLIVASIASAATAVLATGAVLVVWWRKRRDVAPVEQILWFASPLIVLPALVMLFTHQAWRNRHESLLQGLLLVALLFEVLVFQSLVSIPDRVRAGWRWVAARLPKLWQEHGPLMVVLAGAVFYSCFMSFYFIRWHQKLETHVFDLAINTNLMGGGLKGVFMHSTVVFPDDPGRYLATHAKFGAYLFLPLYALYPHPETLMVLQSTLLGFAAVPLYGFARQHVSPWMAVLVAVAYLCYYPMHGANFSEIQWVPIASCFVLATIWAAEARRWVLFGIAFAFAALMREEVSIGLAVVGAFLLVSGHRPRAGLIMAVVATAWFIFLRFYVMEKAGDWWFPKMYKGLWAPGETGFKSVIKTLITNPIFVLNTIIEERKVYYLMHLLVPLVFLPARRWYLWLAFLPGAVVTLLATDYKPPTMFSFQYVMFWTPYLFAAAVLALAAIEKRGEHGPLRARAAAAGMLLASLVLTYNYGAFPARDGSLKGGYSMVSFGWSPQERERYANLRELIRMIPPDASVAATERVGAHVGSRQYFYAMRNGPHDAEYILASDRELKLARTKPELKAAVQRGEYGVLRRIGDFALFKRGFDTAGNAKLMQDWNL